MKAIIVYPMNALANSQHGELEKFLHFGFDRGDPPVRFEKYTGQQAREERDRILKNPPDIILTNYVMLELMSTQPDERELIAAAEGLRFLGLRIGSCPECVQREGAGRVGRSVPGMGVGPTGW